MATTVGTKGQVVIEKRIRDKLGIQPGWMALQMLVDDHVEIRFLPPEHNESLRGILAPYTDVSFPTEEALREAIERAWELHAEEEEARISPNAKLRVIRP